MLGLDAVVLRQLVTGAVVAAKFVADKTATKVDDAVVAAVEAGVNSPWFDSLWKLLFGSPSGPAGPFVVVQSVTAVPEAAIAGRLPSGVTLDDIRAKAAELGIPVFLIPIFLQLILKLLGR